MATARQTRPVEHEGRVTRSRQLSKATLEFCDMLIDGVTLSTQAPDFEAKAKQIATAKREVAAALKEAGGKPLAEQRAAQAAVMLSARAKAHQDCATGLLKAAAVVFGKDASNG